MSGMTGSSEGTDKIAISLYKFMDSSDKAVAVTTWLASSHERIGLT